MREDTKTIRYEPPKVITYSADDLIEQIGPAKSCSFGGGNISCW